MPAMLHMLLLELFFQSLLDGLSFDLSSLCDELMMLTSRYFFSMTFRSKKVLTEVLKYMDVGTAPP